MKFSAVFVACMVFLPGSTAGRPSFLASTHPTVVTDRWAGAILMAPPVGQTFSSVVGTFAMPCISGSDGAASVWVGIDGYSHAPILQAGVKLEISGGETSYTAWKEWYNGSASYINKSDLSISAGDTIRVQLDAVSSVRASVTIENLSTGVVDLLSLDAPSPSYDLQGQTAEWIVEDFARGGKNDLVPLVDFGTVTFTEASASTAQQSVDLTDATISNMKQKGKVLTAVVISSSESVAVKHV